MTKGLKKAHELTDAKIQFVSLVDRAANKRQFLITKQDGDQVSFSTYGRILKADADTHYVTGIVYEPMTEDSQGEFMTEEEITKAAYWYAKNGDKVDLQHSFDPLPGAAVVESWVEKADTEINGEEVKKGTWLMTVEVTDNDVWDGIQKGDITGFSMGGQAMWNEEDVDLSTVEKTNESSGSKKGLLKMLAEALGMTTVEKGEVTEVFEEDTKYDMFWNAFNALEEALRSWNYMTDNYVYETDEAKITEALTEFNEIITGILTAETPVIKQVMDARPVQKAAQPVSNETQKTLQGIYDTLGNVLKSFDENGSGAPAENDPDVNIITKEDNTDMTREEVEGLVNEAVEKAVSALAEKDTEKAAEQTAEQHEDITAESIQKMVDAAVEKAMQPAEDQLTADDVQEMVTKAVGTAMEPILASRGLPSALNDTVEKAAGQKSQHYLHGIL